MTNTERRRMHRRYKQTRFKIIVCTLIIIFGMLTIGNLNEILMMQTDTLNRLDSLEQELVKQDEKDAVSEDLTPSGIFTITHYCSCSKCCGKSDGICKNGEKAIPDYTIATDPDVIPTGSIVVIDRKEYKAMDTGGEIKGNKIDIFVSSHQEAINRGKFEREVRYEI